MVTVTDVLQLLFFCTTMSYTVNTCISFQAHHRLPDDRISEEIRFYFSFSKLYLVIQKKIHIFAQKNCDMIKNEAAYRAALKRVEQLEEIVDDENQIMDDNAHELDMLIDLIEEYEEIHYPIGKPSLVDTIKLRLYEMGITQNKLAEMLNLSPARVSEIMSGKSEPTLKIGRAISQKFGISPSIVLGV